MHHGCWISWYENVTRRAMHHGCWILWYGNVTRRAMHHGCWISWYENVMWHTLLCVRQSSLKLFLLGTEYRLSLAVDKEWNPPQLLSQNRWTAVNHLSSFSFNSLLQDHHFFNEILTETNRVDNETGETVHRGGWGGKVEIVSFILL